VIALDASALLAYLFRERGHERVGAVLREGCVSAVNVAEVLGRFARDGHDVSVVLGALRRTPLEMVVFDSTQAAVVAALAPRSRPLGLSLGDRACLALAISRGIPAMTADATWKRMEWGTEIQVIR
jgi:PIN domain nuclease of toxin-antitoxin system